MITTDDVRVRELDLPHLFSVHEMIAVPAGVVYHLTEGASSAEQLSWYISLRRTYASMYRPTDATVARSMCMSLTGLQLLQRSVSAHLCIDARCSCEYVIGGAGRVSVVDAVCFSVLQDLHAALDAWTGLWSAIHCPWQRQPQLQLEHDCMFARWPGLKTMRATLCLHSGVKAQPR